MKSHVPVMDEIIQVLMAVGWALLIGNYYHIQDTQAPAGNCGAVCYPRRTHHDGAVGICHGRQQKHRGHLQRLVQNVRLHVPFDGDQCDLLQNASVRPLHSAKRAGCISVDCADPDPRKGRKKGGCHHHPHWVESGHHRRLSRAAAARRTDLHGCALGGLAHYQECWEVCRWQRQRLLLQRFSERQRPTHGRTVRRRPLCKIYCERLLSESTAAKRTARGRRASLRLPQRHGSDGRSADSLAGT